MAEHLAGDDATETRPDLLPPTLRRKIGLARLATAAETLWPRLTLIAAVLLLFLAATWSGLFSATPRALRITLGIGFAVLAGYALWRIACWRAPGPDAGARRLDLSNPALHRPVAVMNDRVAGDDPVAAALWNRHRERAEEAAARLTVPLPVNPVPRRDPYALRALVLLLAVSAAFVAGDERVNRLADAFSWGEPKPPPVPPRLDAWIDPPVYTGRAPVFLSGVNAASGPVSVPTGSTLTVRVVPAEGIALSAPPAFRAKEPEAQPGTAPAAARNAPDKPATQTVFESRMTIEGDGVIDIRRAGASMGQFDIRAIPDAPPTVELTAIERDDKAQSLKLRYRLEDDYGIARTEALVGRADRAGGRTLFPPPDLPLSGRLGENESAVSVQEHPWAGVKVTIRVKATDDIGQSATSTEMETVLPVRRFENPVSRALVEQRRNLVMNPDDRRTVAIGLSGMMVAPERYTRKSGDYLMLSIAARKLRDARTDAHLIDLANYLWDTAVALDEGNLTEAERNLRAAEERLREAMERGAGEDEIKKLMEELRQAMNEFLREFAERAQRNQDRAENDRDRDSRTLTQRDLNDLMKQIEELYRQGDSAKAQELLRQLQEMMKNLQSARRQPGQGDQRTKEMGEALDELERMMRDQENLRDETFRENQKRRMGQAPRQRQPGQQGQRGQRQPGQQGQQGQQGEGGEDDGGEGEDESSEGLGNKQQALRDRLKQLRDKLRRQGAGDEEGFDGAEDGMGDAEQNLRNKQGGRATQGQQRALDELGKAGRGLSQQMQRQMGEGGEPGDGEDGFGPGNPSGQPRGRADSNTDPLGRPLAGRRDQMDNSRVRIPGTGEYQGSVAERAQRVLEELRKRFGETLRPQDELDYIERLLRQK